MINPVIAQAINRCHCTFCSTQISNQGVAQHVQVRTQQWFNPPAMLAVALGGPPSAHLRTTPSIVMYCDDSSRWEPDKRGALTHTQYMTLHHIRLINIVLFIMLYATLLSSDSNFVH